MTVAPSDFVLLIGWYVSTLPYTPNTAAHSVNAPQYSGSSCETQGLRRDVTSSKCTSWRSAVSFIMATRLDFVVCSASSSSSKQQAARRKQQQQPWVCHPEPPSALEGLNSHTLFLPLLKSLVVLFHIRVKPSNVWIPDLGQNVCTTVKY